MQKKNRDYKHNDIKNLIMSKLKIIFQKRSKFNLKKVDRFPIYFKLNRNLFKKNVLAIGESVYTVYPIAGQGFNLVLRDIETVSYTHLRAHET